MAEQDKIGAQARMLDRVERARAERAFAMFLGVVFVAAAALIIGFGAMLHNAPGEKFAPAIAENRAVSGERAPPPAHEAAAPSGVPDPGLLGGYHPQRKPLKVSSDETRAVKVGRGDTLIEILTAQGVDPEEAHKAAASMARQFNPARLRAGQLIEISTRTTSILKPDAPLLSNSEPRIVDLLGLKLRPRIDQYVGLRKSGEGAYEAYVEAAPLQRRVNLVADRIETSLYQAAARRGMSDAAIAEFINVFAFDVDFQREIRRGDSFEALHTTLYDENGAPALAGDILYAALELSGERKAYYRFTTPDDGKTDYFDGEGKSAKKFLMKTPIDGARISSSFGRRRHPILGYSRMHKGVDFAAPKGTPIKAAGDGVIERSRRFGSFGNYVRLRHDNGYKTVYAHLSGYGPGVKEGRRVRQGQIIGYVGDTGKVTGVHLHYEVHRNDDPINPLALRVSTGRHLEGEVLAAFLAEKTRIDALRAEPALDAPTPEGGSVASAIR